MSNRRPQPWNPPPYTYVPGGPWPHPTGSPLGHMHGKTPERPPPIENDAWPESTAYLHGVRLFNAGYYWEAHEVWESLWHAHGRRGPTATVLKGLIKLAAAGVKIREGRPGGAQTLAQRASSHFAEAAEEGPRRLGLDLEQWIRRAKDVAAAPPAPQGTSERPEPVFRFILDPQPIP